MSTQAGADFVWTNDAWDDTHAPLVANLSAASGDPVGWQGPQDAWQVEHSADPERAGGESAGRARGEFGERQRSHSSASTSNGVHTEGRDEGRRGGPGEHSTGVGLHDGTAPGGKGTHALTTSWETGTGSINGSGGGGAVSEGSSEHRAPERNGGIRDAGATSSPEENEKEEWTTARDSSSAEQGDRGSGREPRWRVSHLDATKLLNSCSQNSDFYDIVDIDSFGSDSAFLGDALRAVRYGGMVYVTSTDGFALAGGHRPAATLAAYGSYARPVPFGNEMGLRILMGTVVSRPCCERPVDSCNGGAWVLPRVKFRCPGLSRRAFSIWFTSSSAFLLTSLHGTHRRNTSPRTAERGARAMESCCQAGSACRFQTSLCIVFVCTLETFPAFFHLRGVVRLD
jgi:hypothetical protein